MRIRICKCGHLKNEHFDKKPKEFYSTGQCNKCKCSRYLNRKLPNLSSKFLLYYGVAAMTFFIFSVPVMYFITPIGKHWDDKVMPVSIVMLCILGLFLIGSIIVFQSCILRYYYEKRIRIFPIEDGENQK